MRIFSLDDFYEKRIPDKEDFSIELDKFEEECVFPYLGNEVVGGFSYGSVNRGDCNIASDIDYFMLISDERHRKIVRSATRKALEANVLVQVRAISEDHARRGLHSIDDSFRQHLELSSSLYGYHGKNPLDLLKRKGASFEENLRESMTRYLLKLTNGMTNYPSNDLEDGEFLRAILEKPFHAMRVAIQYEYGSVAPKGVEFKDSKEQLIRIYREIRPDLLTDIEKIEEVKRKYLDLLSLRKSGDIKNEKVFPFYGGVLEEIGLCYDQAYHFIDENARMISK